jgi:glycosyltransferase involved in cell wall biosynthesis
MTAVSRVRDAIEWRVNGARSISRSVWRTAGFDRAQRVPLTLRGEGRVPVILCAYHRLERLPRTLEMLAAQDVPVQALIWDNSADTVTVDKAASDARIPVTVHHSTRNIGGFARFYAAREAAEAGYETVVFIDDDLDFEPGTVGDLLRAHRPKSLSGWFAFTQFLVSQETWVPPGEPAVYVGSGGMVIDSAIFTDPRLYTCPRRYWLLEDVWLSYFARQAGYDLFASPARFTEVLDGSNQSLSLGWARRRLVRYLDRKGPQATPA